MLASAHLHSKAPTHMWSFWGKSPAIFAAMFQMPWECVQSASLDQQGPHMQPVDQK